MSNENEHLGIRRVGPCCWEIPQQGGMRVPGRIYANDALMRILEREQAPQQVANVAHMPGIVKYAIAMPDIHWGYGFPIGGVAAFDLDEGVVSPGGVGYDINCGVRLLRTDLMLDDVQDRMKEIVKSLYKTIPSGMGRGGAIPRLGESETRRLLQQGARWAVEHGYGRESDLAHIEDGGTMPGADPDRISRHAIERGLDQVGTLGSGNHFLEVDVVEEIYLPDIAEHLGLVQGGIAVSVHSGSRGLGYQICDDAIKVHRRAMGKYHIQLPDQQLACAPVSSPEGKEYLAQMACAANFAWVNRQVIMTLAEQAIAHALGRKRDALGFRLIYDVCHNIAKLEEHVVDGVTRKLLVHRKGATRAFAPGHPLVPEAYRAIGQPVFVPGDMGRASYLLIGASGAMSETFGSSCHGAGRVASRSKMIKQTQGRDLFRELADRGVTVMAKNRTAVAEEMPEAYKDVSEVVDTIETAGISRKLVKLRPIGVIKG